MEGRVRRSWRRRPRRGRRFTSPPRWSLGSPQASSGVSPSNGNTPKGGRHTADRPPYCVPLEQARWSLLRELRHLLPAGGPFPPGGEHSPVAPSVGGCEIAEAEEHQVVLTGCERDR